MNEFAIEAVGLCKQFGQKTAVANLTLQVKQGEIFGFLGPNGAGKTTSIKMLLGLIAPTAGSATLLGQPLGDRLTRAKIGFLPEHFRFHEWLKAGRIFRFARPFAANVTVGATAKHPRASSVSWFTRPGRDATTSLLQRDVAADWAGAGVVEQS